MILLFFLMSFLVKGVLMFLDMGTTVLGQVYGIPARLPIGPIGCL